MTSEVSQVPVPPQKLLVPEPDDFQLRVFNYNPQDEKVSLEAHPAYIPSLAGHPALQRRRQHDGQFLGLGQELKMRKGKSIDL